MDRVPVLVQEWFTSLSPLTSRHVQVACSTGLLLVTTHHVQVACSTVLRFTDETIRLRVSSAIRKSCSTRCTQSCDVLRCEIAVPRTYELQGETCVRIGNTAPGSPIRVIYNIWLRRRSNTGRPYPYLGKNKRGGSTVQAHKAVATARTMASSHAHSIQLTTFSYRLTGVDVQITFS